jgi:hypothetical protein
MLMKAVLEFNYPQDTEKCRRAIHADDAFAALLDIYGLLHKKYASKADLEDVVRAVREITEHALANSGEK